jgi:hypothetical protein
MKNWKKLAMMFAMQAALSAGHEPHYFEPKRPKKQSQKKLPNGFKQWHFSQIGELMPVKNNHTIFSCIAINEENARRKFINRRL